MTGTSPGRPIRVRWLVKGLGPGGAERLLVAAAGAHDREGFSFDVEYLLPWKDALVPELDALNVPTHCLEVRDERDLRWARRLRHHLVTEPVDVLHAHSPYPAAIGRLVVRTLPRRVRPALVYTLHNTWGSFAWPTRLLNGLTLPLDAADLAVSNEVRDTMWPPLRNRTEVLVHGLPLAATVARSARSEVRAELGIGDEEVIVGTVANFRAQKDYPNLFAAAEVLARREVPVRIFAVGQGPLEGDMRARLDAMGLGDRVVILGRRDDAVRVLSGCDLFTLASDNEGLPVALMEALALGLPVVATAVGGVPGAVGRAESILVPPKNPAALASAIEELVRDPARRKTMGAAAAANAARYDITSTTRRLEALYRSLVGQ